MEIIKNVLKKIGILLIVALVIIGIREFVLWHGVKTNLDKSNPMTKEEIIALLDKGAKYSNYSYTVGRGFSKTCNYVKDNVLSSYMMNKLVTKIDYNTGEWKSTLGTCYVDLDTLKYEQHGIQYCTVVDYETFKEEYEYLGEKDIEGRRMILIQMNWSGDSKIYKTATIFVIDKETGLIFEKTQFQKTLFVTAYKRKDNYNINFDVCEKI